MKVLATRAGEKSCDIKKGGKDGLAKTLDVPFHVGFPLCESSQLLGAVKGVWQRSRYAVFQLFETLFLLEKPAKSWGTNYSST